MVFILKGFREEYGIEVSALGIFYLANVSFLFYFFLRAPMVFAVHYRA